MLGFVFRLAGWAPEQRHRGETAWGEPQGSSVVWLGEGAGGQGWGQARREVWHGVASAGLAEVEQRLPPLRKCVLNLPRPLSPGPSSVGFPGTPPPHLLCRCPQGRWILHSGGTGSPAAPGKSPGEDARERRVAELLHSAAFWNRAAFRISSHNLYSNEGHLKGVT